MEKLIQNSPGLNSVEYNRRSGLPSPPDIFEMHSEMLELLADLTNAHLQLELDDPADCSEVDVSNALNRVRVARQGCDDIIQHVQDVQPTTQDERNLKRQTLYLYYAHFNVDQMTYQLSFKYMLQNDV